MTEKRDAIVQVSVPFCVDDRALRREGMILGWDSARMARYADALVAEIEANAGQFDDCLVRAVQLGGGAMRSSIANVSGATMPFFRRAGVTRFDFEMLSLNPVDFVRLNRVDNLNDLPIICDHFLHSYANDTLGLVLAFGHDASEGGDGALNVRRTALAAARSHATHAELVRVADELAAGCDEVARQLDEMRGALTEHGFMEYLPLRFARAGKEDRFAQMAAAGVPQIGFGLGAITRIDGAESVNTRDLARYCAAEGDFAKITEEVRKTR